MFIISCILSITKMSKEELADFVSVNKNNIDSYLNGEEIPKKIRERFATIFSFPVFYFDVDVSEDEYFKKLIKATIRKEWENNKPQKYKLNITDDIIIDSLLNAYDPVTHEKFDEDHILNNKYIKDFLNRTLKKEKNLDSEIIDDNENNLYNTLINWRKNKSEEENLSEATIISDKIINNILNTNIDEKKDLLKVSGIGLATYGKYGDDIYNIIKENNGEIEVLNI